MTRWKKYLLSRLPIIVFPLSAVKRIVAQELQNGGIDTEIVNIGTKEVRGCISCFKCQELGHCVFSNDLVSELAHKFELADGLVVGSPVYYASANGSLIYDAIDSEYGYIRCSSFADSFSQLNLYYVLSYLVREKACKGLIVDVRDNTGGSIENALQLASVFFASDTTIGFTQHKTGKRHIDLSEPEPIEISKKDYSGMYVSLPVAVLTNRLSYSATNLFACAMKSCDKCIIIGDRTGGGGGIPLSYELPNGWLIRFSSVKMTDTEHKSIEDGIEPDIKIDLISTDVDDIIEEAKKQIDSFSQQQNKKQRK